MSYSIQDQQKHWRYMDYTKQKSVNKNDSIANRIGFLRYCSELYENGGASPISDKEWDIEYYELLDLAPNDPFFDEVGGQLSEDVYGQSVKHEITMGSLSKARDIDEFVKWAKSTYGNSCPSFVLQHKVDGLSLSILYKNGKIVQCATRGDGANGILVTQNCEYIKDIPQTIPSIEEVEIRGEVYKNRQDFYKNWHTSVGGEYAMPRSFASGSINQIDPKVTGERKLSFIGYEIVRKSFDTEIEKIQFIDGQGIPSSKNSTRRTKAGITPDELGRAVKAYMDAIDRANLPYDIDGVVVKNNDVKAAKSMGYTNNGKKPKANIAVKFPAEEKETILEGIEVNIGRIGNATPVGLLKPVELGGAMISRVSLHNFGMIRDSKDLKIGSVVVLAKKGDIIPQIIRVKKAGSKDIEIPTHCPCCNEQLTWDGDPKNAANIVCTNTECTAQLASKIEHWFDKIGVKGIGPGIINRLTDKSDMSWDNEPIVGKLSHMYYKLNNDRKTEHPFQKYAYLKKMMGERTYEILIENINSVKELTLAKFIEALGIGKIGSMSKEIAAIAPTVDDVDKLTVDDLKKIDKFGDIKANNFIDGWKKMRREIDNLLRSIVIVQPKLASDKMKGMKFCFTGSFSVPREQLQQMVVDNGGKAANSVGKDVILCWDGEENGSKLAKAKAGGNKIISEEDFMALLK